MLRHDFHPPEARSGGSIQIARPVHPQGRTPIQGPASKPIDSHSGGGSAQHRAQGPLRCPRRQRTARESRHYRLHTASAEHPQRHRPDQNSVATCLTRKTVAHGCAACPVELGAAPRPEGKRQDYEPTRTTKTVNFYILQSSSVDFSCSVISIKNNFDGVRGCVVTVYNSPR
jgi:hypothetical protein